MSRHKKLWKNLVETFKIKTHPIVKRFLSRRWTESAKWRPHTIRQLLQIDHLQRWRHHMSSITYGPTCWPISFICLRISVLALPVGPPRMMMSRDFSRYRSTTALLYDLYPADFYQFLCRIFSHFLCMNITAFCNFRTFFEIFWSFLFNIDKSKIK